MFKPKFKITNEINKNLMEIERVRGFLEATKLKQDWISEMQNELLILETHYSTHIEGTQLTLEQATKILTGKKVTGIRTDDKKELLNYKKALGYVSTYLGKEEIVTEELIKEIHKILVSEVRGNPADPGNYRRIQNYVVNSLTGEVIYTPPSPEEVPSLMKEFIEWLKYSIEATDISPIIIAGIAQYQFVHIHPFLDGNGRSARVLSTLILYKTGYDFKKLFTLSEFYDKNRPEYYKAIQSVREHKMDMTQWLEYFTEGLKHQMADIKKRGVKAIKKDVVEGKIKKHGLSERQAKALRYLIEEEYISRAKYVELYKVSLRTANYDLSILEKLKLIKREGIGRAIKYRLT